MCLCWRKRSLPPVDEFSSLGRGPAGPKEPPLPNHMDFRFVPEPYLSEILSYVRHRHEHIHCFASPGDVRLELMRIVVDDLRPADLYPRGRQLVGDDDYLLVLRDMFNLSNVLDDMELTGCIPYHNRGHYYNCYSRLYRMLLARAKQQGGG